MTDGRVAVKYPKILFGLAVVFAVLPVANYVAVAFYSSTSLADFWGVVDRLGKAPNGVRLFFLLTPFAVAIGLFRVKRWGWWLSVGYTAALTVYDLYTLLGNRGLYNLGATLQTIFGGAAIVYLTRKDIYAPYLASEPRGWRANKRYPLVLDVTVAGAVHKSRDLSGTGIYVSWDQPTAQVGQTLEISFSLGGEELRTQAEVRRVEPAGVGMAFRGLDDRATQRLKAFLVDQKR